MPPRPLARLPVSVLARLGALLLAVAPLVPGRPLQAAPAVCAPVAHDDSVAAFTDQDFQRLYVLDNDTLSGCNPFDVTISAVGFSAHGDPVGGPLTGPYFAVDYKPSPGFAGDDHFTYTISDGHGHQDTANVTVHVGASGAASNRFAIYAGPNDSSRWTISPFGGTSGSNPANGVCNGSAGLSVEDAFLETNVGHYNAFDNGMTMWVNNTEVTPALPMAVTRHSLVSGPTLVSGLRVYLKYDGLSGSNTLRTLLSLINVTGASIPATVNLATNLGTDANTVIPGTSSGDGVFDPTDRWVVSSDSPTNPGEIVATHVLFGPGSPLVTPDLATTTVFGCGDLEAQTSPTDPHGIRSRFVFSVPAGSTRNLLFFNQAHDSNSLALSDAHAFDHEPMVMLDGLSNSDLTDTVNWKLGPISRLYLPLVQR